MRVWRLVVGVVTAPLMAAAGAVVGLWFSLRWAVTGRRPDAWRTTATGGPTPEEVNEEVARLIAHARKAAKN